MNNLYDPARASEIRARLDALSPNSQALWGKMSVSQALAHCAGSLEMALGDVRPKRMLAGRIFGSLVKRLALGDDKPIKRNSPTSPDLTIRDNRDFNVEHARVRALIDRFATGGRAVCTTHPHTFFGPMTPDEWAVLMYKHMDHHLRQFNA